MFYINFTPLTINSSITNTKLFYKLIMENKTLENLKDNLSNHMENKLKDLKFIINKKQIKTLFQPIISLRDGSILGHEALSRITCESEIENTEELFKIASDFNMSWELELLCRTTSLESAYKLMIPPYSKKLFLNINPNIIQDDNYKKGFTKSFLKQYDIESQNVIIEITERNVISELNNFIRAIDHYKDQDYKIAIDDAGAGYSGLNLISDVNPHYLKLDMKLIRDIDKDKLKYSLVKGMAEFSNASGTNLIAEGIETYEELEVLIDMGVQYGHSLYQNKQISEIMDRDFLSVDYVTPVSEVSKLAMDRPNSRLYDFIVVTEDEKYIGTVTIKDHIHNLCTDHQ